ILTSSLGIHCNAGPPRPGSDWVAPSLSGIETWYHYGSKEGQRVAAIFQRERVNITGWKNRGLKTTREKGLYILRHTQMPSIMLETGFLNNKEQVKELMNNQVRQDIAYAIVRAIVEVERVAGNTTVDVPPRIVLPKKMTEDQSTTEIEKKEPSLQDEIDFNGDTIYVKEGSNGDGSSWESPTGNLISALETAKYGDQIWIAAGNYLPTTSNDRSTYFEVKDGIGIYGGFNGTEISLNQRDWKNNRTVLSGNIGTASIDDNSYTILYTNNVSESTIIDGLIFRGGTANGTGQEGTLERCGGAWFNDGRRGKSNPKIINCIFNGNQARDGGEIVIENY
ncbi:MAG: N-acetylmuramoyl-L-alanine amidase, partial [Bacteroidota bacterium]